MKTLHCPKCNRAFRVADNVTGAYCNVGHMTAAYHEGLPAEDGKVYPIGWLAWLDECRRILERCYGSVSYIPGEIVAAFRGYYDTKRSPADAVRLEYGVHL